MQTQFAHSHTNSRRRTLEPTMLVQKSAPAKRAMTLSRARRTTILKALADPNRFALLERIARSSCGELGCSELREALRVAPATLSHHLKELEAAALIKVRREGKFVFLSPHPGTVEA